jgi:hypothetical protein
MDEGVVGGSRSDEERIVFDREDILATVDSSPDEISPEVLQSLQEISRESTARKSS